MLQSYPKTLIIGAGVVGAFLAYRLAQQGQHVTVLDRKEAGQEASGLNAGSLSIQNKPSALVDLAVKGVEGWQSFEQESGYDTGFHQTGGLRVANDEAGVDKLRQDAQRHHNLGITIEHIDGAEARERCNLLGPGVLAANWSPYDGHNNALIATKVVLEAAVDAGVTFLSGTEVTALRTQGEAVEVTTSRGELVADRVVICAGLWCRPLCEQLGMPLKLNVRNNQMMVTSPQPPMLNIIITHVTGRLTLKQVDAGSLLIGGGWPGAGDVTTNRKWTNLDSMVGNARMALKVMPSLAHLRVIRSWAGFDGRTADQLPLVGRVKDHPNIWLCTSCFGAYTLGPALGGLLAQWLVTGEQPEELKPFSPELSRNVT